MGKLRSIIKLLRPHQWTKNAFVLLPLFFAHRMTDIAALENGFIAFLAFSFVSSAIYCLNDLIDVKADREHSIKCKRPVASGEISKVECVIISVIMLTLSIITALTCNFNLALVIVSYFVLNIMYVFKLKQYAIVDVFVISIGFVLRLVAGGVAASVELSQWIVLTTFLLSLFLAFAKRRDDVLIYENSGVKARANIARYNLDFLNSTMAIVSTITIVAYIMYTVSPEVIERLGIKYLYLTSIPVIAGILRYLQCTLVDKNSGSPSKVLIKDRFIHAVIVIWVLSFIIIMYV